MTYVITSKQAGNIDYQLVSSKKIKRAPPKSGQDAKNRSDIYEKHLKEVAKNTS